MSAVSLLNAERIKLATTRSSVWIAVGVAVLSLALAALQGGLASSSLEPQRAALGIAVFGVPVLMVLASMTVTAEYRSGMIRTTFLAAPNRSLVLVCKAVVVAVFSGVYAAALVLGSILTARAVAAVPAGAELSTASGEVWRVAGAVGLYAALAAVLGVGVGALLRAGPGAVAVLLLWPLVVEPMLANLPDVGTRVGPYLPFANIFLVTEVPWLYPVYAMAWGPAGSLVLFVAVVAVVFGAAVAVVNVRDA
ncbi:ABC transporter permease [Mycolicibacterium flavescens]|uniref:ABC transporter permease n=1 Tax=Mycolicibacterium flavescens TaxID=1776 RepID=A0A1E3RFQ0_MYCFV|nr:ABC transporter permease [Mycolicibacterium flavescens]MCV7282767.1 ABC transporter permease [Mycolicibacterium flavescens]ODQ88683.1 ABC transporter permease [Mycolicibacterium flavescens]